MSSSRTWQAGKPKKKPDYDPEGVTQDLLDAAASIYNDENARYIK